MNSIHKKEVDCILMSAAAVLALVTVIMGATQKAMTLNVNFSLQLILSLSAAVTVAILRFFANFDFLPLAMSVLLSAGFGMIRNEGLPVIVDKINDISFQGGNFPLVMTYVIMSFAACLLSIIACFLKKRK